MRKQISIDQLVPGMYVAATDRSWLGVPFFRRKIRNQRAIDRLREHRVTEVVIDTEKGCDLAPGSESQEVEVFHHPELVRESLAQSKSVHDQAMALTKDLMNRVSQGELVDREMVDRPVKHLLQQILEDPQSMLCISVLQNSDEYTFDHCVNVSILSLFLGKSVGLPADKMLALGRGALLHDIGKCMVPKEIIAKPGKLDEQEAEIVRTHVERGLRYLDKMRGIDREVIDFVRDHHERMDGSGYPRGLRGEEISWYGRVGAVLDVYDALIHENYYKGAMDPLSVLEEMRGSVGRLFDPRAFRALSDCLGHHPPGTILMLDSGEIAIAFEPNEEDAARPRVLLMTRENGSFHEHPLPVDLCELSEETGTFSRSILTTMTLEEIAFDPFRILGSFSLSGTDLH